MDFAKNPIVIGAVAGSGTRIFTKIVSNAGVFMGSDLNSAEENENNKSFYRAWLPLYLHKKDGLSDVVREELNRDFEEFIRQHLSNHPHPSLSWGLKHPNNLLMIPFWNEIFPQMKFIHVIRNGLDMVYSMKRIQYQTYQWFFLDFEDQDKGSSSQIKFWSQVNERAADFGENYLGDRYLRIRFEDLCNNPEEIVPQIFDFVNAPDRSKLKDTIAEICLPKTLGRWRSQPVKVVHELMGSGKLGLQRFGYWNQSNWNKVEQITSSPDWQRYVFQRTKMKSLTLN